MNEEQNKQKDLLDTTDCLEAVEVFRSRKNVLFIIVMCCLLILQTSFWLVDTGVIKIPTITEAKAAAVDTVGAQQITKQVTSQKGQELTEPNTIQRAAEKVAAEPNVIVLKAPQAASRSTIFEVTYKRLSHIIRFFNFVLILAAVLYCLTMLFSLKISLLGRLGGINHISRAFFTSLLMALILLPWQKFFGPVVAGVIYSPAELSDFCAGVEANGIFSAILFYLRFTVYWVVAVLLLIFAQWRSIRWAKATLRRLEVVL
ncbi:MAG: hypothetical protein JXB29_02365 [Sedimentisphaerales bacterium]|nr:hypothetical protein [Sedimentisphaerales bacterium]